MDVAPPPQARGCRVTLFSLASSPREIKTPNSSVYLQRTAPDNSVITGVCGYALGGCDRSPQERRLKSVVAAPNNSTNTSVHNQLLKTGIVLPFSRQAGGTGREEKAPMTE